MAIEHTKAQHAPSQLHAFRISVSYVFKVNISEMLTSTQPNTTTEEGTVHRVCLCPRRVWNKGRFSFKFIFGFELLAARGRDEFGFSGSPLGDLIFLQRSFWKFKFSGKSSLSFLGKFRDVSKNYTAFFFRVKQSVETSGSIQHGVMS